MKQVFLYELKYKQRLCHLENYSSRDLGQIYTLKIKYERPYCKKHFVSKLKLAITYINNKKKSYLSNSRSVLPNNLQ